jgi:hypothetical protein
VRGETPRRVRRGCCAMGGCEGTEDDCVDGWSVWGVRARTETGRGVGRGDSALVFIFTSGSAISDEDKRLKGDECVGGSGVGGKKLICCKKQKYKRPKKITCSRINRRCGA